MNSISLKASVACFRDKNSCIWLWPNDYKTHRALGYCAGVKHVVLFVARDQLNLLCSTHYNVHLAHSGLHCTLARLECCLCSSKRLAGEVVIAICFAPVGREQASGSREILHPSSTISGLELLHKQIISSQSSSSTYICGGTWCTVLSYEAIENPNL